MQSKKSWSKNNEKYIFLISQPSTQSRQKYLYWNQYTKIA